jgi:hypothetical protein
VLTNLRVALATTAPLRSVTVPETLPPVAPCRDRDEKQSRIRTPIFPLSIKGTNLESSLRTVCGAVGIYRWTFLHARKAAPMHRRRVVYRREGSRWYDAF